MLWVRYPAGPPWRAGPAGAVATARRLTRCRCAASHWPWPGPVGAPGDPGDHLRHRVAVSLHLVRLQGEGSGAGLRRSVTERYGRGHPGGRSVIPSKALASPTLMPAAVHITICWTSSVGAAPGSALRRRCPMTTAVWPVK